jgi:hypothetical protein
VKKVLVLLLVVASGVAVYRLLSRTNAAARSRPHQHGTPDHWPPVVRKPGSKSASVA